MVVALLSLTCLAAQDAAALNQAGVQALKSGDLKGALSQFQAALKLDPKNAEVQFNLGLTMLRMGRPEKAAASLERVVSNEALSTEARYLLSTCYFQLLEHEKVVAVLKDFPDGPRTEHVLYMLEESNRMLGHKGEARDAFRQLNRRFPDSAWTHFLLGMAYENEPNFDRAIQEYKTALDRDSKLPNAAFAIGYLYWRQQDAENAKVWLQKEVEAQPCHALAVFYLGQIARAEQDKEAAEKHYRHSIACDADSVEAHLRLGMTLEEMNQNSEALHELKRAVELAPKNVTAHYRLALIYRKLGRAQDSEAEYETVRRLKAAGQH